MGEGGGGWAWAWAWIEVEEGGHGWSRSGAGMRMIVGAGVGVGVGVGGRVITSACFLVACHKLVTTFSVFVWTSQENGFRHPRDSHENGSSHVCAYLQPLYKHMFPPALAPSLSFVGLPWKIVPFPQMELQAKLIARCGLSTAVAARPAPTGAVAFVPKQEAGAREEALRKDGGKEDALRKDNSREDVASPDSLICFCS